MREGFSVGDRVVVTDNYRYGYGAGGPDDMQGYYGHIVALPAHDDDYIYANLLARTGGEPIHPHRVGKIGRFPFYAFELEHAD